MSSEWMKVMLEEIARKKVEAEQDQIELERRGADPSHAEEGRAEQGRAEQGRAELGSSEKDEQAPAVSSSREV